MSAPALVVYVALEARPRVYVDAVDDQAHARLQDWLVSSRSLLQAAGQLLDLLEALLAEQDEAA